MDKLVFSCFLLGGLTPDPGPTECALNAYCATGITNVGCNPPPITGGSACDGKSAEVVQFLDAEQAEILGRFNYYRNQFGYFGKANRMFKLQWDANLAIQAGHNARSCVIARDVCRNTADYTNVGQLISSYSATSAISVTVAIRNAFDAGANFDVYFDGRATFSNYLASTNTENTANVLNDRSTKVGCALMKWTNGGPIFYYLVCNFSANVIEGEPLFKTAATAGLGCATKDTTYDALCLT